MKQKSLKGLMYREYCLTKKAVFSNLTQCVVMVAIFTLMALSLEFGNLKMFLESLNPEDQDSVKNAFFMVGKFYPIVSLSVLSVVCVETCNKETKSKWNKFRLTLPVTPERYAFGKFLYMSILDVCGGLLAALYIFLYSAFAIGKQDAKDYLYLALIICVVSTFMILMANCTLLFRSMDAAGVVFFLLIMGTILAMSFLSEKENVPALILNRVVEFSREHIFLLVVYYVVIHLLGLLVSANLYKRREK